jgi:hypothetical protein
MTHLNVVVTPAEQLRTTDPLERSRPSRTAIALSPNGRLLAFTGRRGDQQHLCPLEKGDAIEVKGTEGAGSKHTKLSRWRTWTWNVRCGRFLEST